MLKSYMHDNSCLSAATERQTTNPSSDELLFLLIVTLTQALMRLEQQEVHLLHLHLVLFPIRTTRKEDDTHYPINLHSITVMHRIIVCHSLRACNK